MYRLYNVLKSKSIYGLVLACFLLFSCSNDDDTVVEEETVPSGYINITYKGQEIELKEIVQSYYLNGNRDTLGYIYIGFIDEKHMISRNSVFLYISNDYQLYRIEFNYSQEGSSYSTGYINHEGMYDDDRTILNYSLSANDKIVRGKFNGKLFNAVEIIDIDNCEFYIER